MGKHDGSGLGATEGRTFLGSRSSSSSRSSYTDTHRHPLVLHLLHLPRGQMNLRCKYQGPKRLTSLDKTINKLND